MKENKAVENEIARQMRLTLAHKHYKYFVDYIKNYKLYQQAEENDDEVDKDFLFLMPKYIEFIFDVIDSLVSTRKEKDACKKLIVSLPVQHGKSHSLSEQLIAYLLMTQNKMNAMCVTYSGELSSEIGRKNRDIIENYGEEFNRRLNPSNNKQNRFTVDVLDAQGEKIRENRALFSTILGQLTGFPSDVTIIDDMYSGISEVYDSIGAKKMKAFRGNVLSRKSATNLTIIVMSRWSDDDMVGQVLREQGHYDREKNPNGWLEIRIPAIRTKEHSIDWIEEKIGRKEGEPLGIAFGKDLQFYANQKEDMGIALFECLFQQSPTSLKLATFVGDKVFHLPLPIEKEQNELNIMSVDMAASEKDGADESAFSLVRMNVKDKRKNDVKVLQVHKDRLNIIDAEQVFYQLYNRWDDEYGVDLIIIENKSNGISLLQMIKENNKNGNTYTIINPKRIRETNPTLKKEVRFMYLSQADIYLNTVNSYNPKTNEYGDKVDVIVSEQMQMRGKVDVLDSIAQVYIYVRDSKQTDKRLRFQHGK